jgi:PPOX class probable F420-dependent enzyme
MTAHKMSDDEVWEFLGAEPAHTGKLATVRADGSPHVAPIWFALEGRSIVFNTGDQTAKGKAMRRDGRVALCVDDERPPFSFVIIEGTVEIIEDVEEVGRWAGIIGGRYMGEERSEEYGRRNGVPGELLVKLRPTKITAMADIAD